MLNRVESFTFTVETATGPFSVRDLSEFFYVFRAVYVAALEALDANPDRGFFRSENWSAYETFAEELALQMDEWTPRTFSLYATLVVDQHEDLQIEDIRRRNPIDFDISAVAPAFFAAAILAGGICQFGTRKVTAPSFKKAISVIRGKTRDYRSKMKNG